MRSWCVMLILCLLGSFAHAKPLIADLSLRAIEIDSRFTGTEILLFGARNDVGDIVVVVRGPERSYVVRKKERKAGIWVNTDQVELNNVEAYYKVASNRTLDMVKNDYLLESLDIGIRNIVLDETKYAHHSDFSLAFLDHKLQDGLYSAQLDEVTFLEDTLFRSIIRFPEKIPRGDYTAEVYLFTDGQLKGVQSIPFRVRKKGFDAFIFDMAYNHSVLYGIIAILIAVISGWVAGIIFRRVS